MHESTRKNRATQYLFQYLFNMTYNRDREPHVLFHYTFNVSLLKWQKRRKRDVAFKIPCGFRKTNDLFDASINMTVKDMRSSFSTDTYLKIPSRDTTALA